MRKLISKLLNIEIAHSEPLTDQQLMYYGIRSKDFQCTEVTLELHALDLQITEMEQKRSLLIAKLNLLSNK